jgi:hypothetical protein
MTKNNETATITVETVVADAAKENLVTPTVPAQATEEKKSVDEFDTPTAEDGGSSKCKFNAVVSGEDGEPHHFDSVAGLLKHITIRALKNRKVQIAGAAVVTAGAAVFAVTRKKATEVIELDGEDDLDVDDESSDNN